MRHWIAGSLGLGLFLAACGDEGVRPGEPYFAEPASQEAAKVIGETDPADLTGSQRAALVYAHAATALALLQAGDAEGGTRHLSHLDASAHPGLMVGLDTMGFDPAPLAAVAAAPQDETAGLAAEAMLAALRPNATGDVKDTVAFLMKALGNAYEAGADAGTISDIEAYQTAYGLAVAARDIAAAQPDEAYSDLRLELELLVRMWPGAGPLTSSTPAPDAEMALALSNVKLVLAGLP
jgi:hypothetical protein